MSSSDLEKGAGALSAPQQPHVPLSRPHSAFLPTYEEHLNAELLGFPKATSYANVQPFDRIQDFATGKAIRRRRAWWSAVSIVLFLIVSGIIGSSIFLYRIAHPKDDGTQTVPQTSMPPRSVVTVTVVPSTVVISVPAASTSTSTVVVTVPAPAPRTSTRIITIVPPSASATSQISVTSSSVPFIAPITLSEASTSETSSTSSTTSSSTSSSVFTPAAPPPVSTPATTASTILVSVTTAEPSTSSPSPIATRTGMGFGFCGLPGEFCA